MKVQTFEEVKTTDLQPGDRIYRGLEITTVRETEDAGGVVMVVRGSVRFTDRDRQPVDTFFYAGKDAIHKAIRA